jgi:hypothetical protein
MSPCESGHKGGGVQCRVESGEVETLDAALSRLGAYVAEASQDAGLLLDRRPISDRPFVPSPKRSDVLVSKVGRVPLTTPVVKQISFSSDAGAPRGRASRLQKFTSSREHQPCQKRLSGSTLSPSVDRNVRQARGERSEFTRMASNPRRNLEVGAFGDVALGDSVLCDFVPAHPPSSDWGLGVPSRQTFSERVGLPLESGFGVQSFGFQKRGEDQ